MPDPPAELVPYYFVKSLIEISGLSDLCFSAFIVLLNLRLENIVQFSYWIIFSPLLLAVTLLVMWASRKRVVDSTLTTFRMVWNLTCVALISFLIILSLNLDHELEAGKEWKVSVMLSPLWAVTFVWLIAATYSMVTYCRFDKIYSSDRLGLLAGDAANSTSVRVSTSSNSVAFRSLEQEKRRGYAVLSVALYIFTITLSPVLICIGLEQDHYIRVSYTIIFTPLYIIDIASACLSTTTFFFTARNQESAFFSLAEISVFFLMTPSSIVFKVFLALQLDRTIDWHWYYVFLPIYLVALFLAVFLISAWRTVYRTIQFNLLSPSHRLQ